MSECGSVMIKELNLEVSDTTAMTKEHKAGIKKIKTLAMPTIYIDNKPYEVKAGKNLLEACLALGFDLPYFCWHPALGSVGACRQCA